MFRYLSVISALKHACIQTRQRLRLDMIESTHLEDESAESNPELHSNAWKRLRAADGVLVPGGFGVRGIEGKILAIRHAREAKIPFLGICLGMQAAVIEYTRTFLGKNAANSQEFVPDIADEDAAVIFMPEGDRYAMGGTMRLGARTTIISENSIASTLYGGKSSISERHRHRYEVNPELVSRLEQKGTPSPYIIGIKLCMCLGLRFSGRDESFQRMEIIELSDHPYFVGVQFHPEFKSRPQRPAPVFRGFLEAIRERNVVS